MSPDVDSETHYLSLKDAIAILNRLAEILLRLLPHPLDLCEVLVTSRSIKSLEVVCGRLMSLQRRLDGTSDAEVAQDEVAKLEREMKPLLALTAKARRGPIPAEQVAMALVQSSNPRVAVQRFLATATDGVDVTTKNMVLTPAHEKPLPRTYDTERAHDITVTVDTTFRRRGLVQVTLLGTEANDPMFRIEDVNTRSITLTVPNDDDLVTLGLSSLAGADVQLRANLKLTLSNSGIEYSGSLISIFEHARVKSTALTQMGEQLDLGL